MVNTRRRSAASAPAGKRPPPSAASIRRKKRPKVPSFPASPPLHAADPSTGAFASSPERISTTPRGRGTAETELPRNLRARSSQTTSADASSIAGASILASFSVLENNLAVPLVTSNVKNVQQGQDIPSLPSGCDASDRCSPDNNTNCRTGKEYATSEFDLGDNVFKVCKDHREIPQNLGSPTLPSPGCQAFNDASGPGICSTSDIQASIDTHRRYIMSGDASSKMESGQIPSQHVDFNSFGQPILDGSEQFSTYVGQMAKTHCAPTFDSWRDVANDIKEQIWKSVTNEYDVPDACKKAVLSKARIALRQWKFQLRRHYDKFETDAERKRNIPKRIKKEDWECFVDMCSTEADRTRRKKGKLARQNLKRYHTTGRSGLGRLAEKLKKQDGTTSVTRTLLYLAGHTSKKNKKKKNNGMEMETENEDDPEIVEIQRMIGNDPNSVFKDLDHDPVALVCGRDRGQVRGLGTGISKTVFHASAPSREIAQQEKRKSESMAAELKTLKISIVQQANEHKILQERLASFEEQVASLMDTRRTQGSSGGSNSEERRLPSTCLVKNLRRKVVARGRINREAILSDETYSIVLDNVYEPQENLYDRDEKFGDVRIGDLITWPKGFVELIGV